MNRLLACFLLTLIVSSFALPTGSTIRAVVGHNINDGDDMSASVVKGIVIGIVVLITIPLLWYAYRLCHRNGRSSEPVFQLPPLTFPNDTPAPNSFALGHINPKFSGVARTKVNAPTYRA